MELEKAQKLFYENEQVKDYFNFWEIDNALAKVNIFLKDIDDVVKEVDILNKVNENTAFNVEFYSDDIYVSKYSNAGEDFGFMVSKGNALKEIISYCENFDPEEHVKVWLESDTKGVPDMFTLVDDARDIKEKLLSLASLIKEWGYDYEK